VRVLHAEGCVGLWEGEWDTAAGPKRGGQDGQRHTKKLDVFLNMCSKHRFVVVASRLWLVCGGEGRGVDCMCPHTGRGRNAAEGSGLVGEVGDEKLDERTHGGGICDLPLDKSLLRVYLHAVHVCAED